jgi:hypothetical protein
VPCVLLLLEEVFLVFRLGFAAILFRLEITVFLIVFNFFASVLLAVKGVEHFLGAILIVLRISCFLQLC